MKIILVNFESFDSPHISEIQALCSDLGYEIMETLSFKPRNRSFLGKGQLESIGQKVQETEAQAVVYNGFLSGLKYKVMERYIKAKILSRVDIIIKVFENRARTVEGKMQVKLASLLYQKSKLIRAWTHLERQRGGGMTIGGPGETQLELDKRMISDKIEFIKKQLAKVEQDRETRRQNRTDPTVALIGYSNAGKSTLFNVLTGSDTNVSSKPFETLDPHTRSMILPNNQKVIVADTVGFVTNLPPFLVKAFKATLEQICHAQVLVCVHDITNPTDLSQIHKWLTILKVENTPIVYVLNKADITTTPAAEIEHEALLVSCNTGQGIQELKNKVQDILDDSQPVNEELPYSNEEQLNWLMKHSLEIKTEYKEEVVLVNARLSASTFNKYKKLFGENK